MRQSCSASLWSRQRIKFNFNIDEQYQLASQTAIRSDRTLNAISVISSPITTVKQCLPGVNGDGGAEGRSENGPVGVDIAKADGAKMVHDRTILATTSKEPTQRRTNNRQPLPVF